MSPPNNMDDSPEARGIRFKTVRQMMAITGVDLAKQLGYTRQTISSWENPGPKGKGLSEKGAMGVVEIAKQRGILCDAQWLLYGMGEAKPASNPSASPEIKTHLDRAHEAQGWMEIIFSKLEAHLQFYKEIESFFLDHTTAVIAEIHDDCMFPVHQKGDWVGGQLTTIGEHLVGKICIVEVDKMPQVRMVQLGEIAGTFHLSYLKKTAETETDIVLKNVTLTNAALITRVWRR